MFNIQALGKKYLKVSIELIDTFDHDILDYDF